jgi:hypothetical protein
MPVRLRADGHHGFSPDLPSSRKWRNWQTHQLEGLAVAIPWGFESPLSHHPLAFGSFLALERVLSQRPSPPAARPFWSSPPFRTTFEGPASCGAFSISGDDSADELRTEAAVSSRSTGRARRRGAGPRRLERLGHKSVNTTLKIYAHALPTQQADAAQRLARASTASGGTVLPSRRCMRCPSACLVHRRPLRSRWSLERVLLRSARGAARLGLRGDGRCQAGT